MDIVLEVFDTFIFDRLYATILPTTATTLIGRNSPKYATSTFSSLRELPTAVHSVSQFFQLRPSEYAYRSAWPRDNIWRQGLSLYLITWCAFFLRGFMALDAHTPTP